MTIYLASKSVARRAVLEGARVPFHIAASSVDEDAAKAQGLERGDGPRDIALALAELKALEISRGCDGYVIGADQTLDFEGRLYDKAQTPDEARARLVMLRGKAHQLHAAVVVAKNGEVLWREVAEATLTMRAFSDAFLDDYMAREAQSALGSVGCYRLEDLGVQLFDKIEGDYFAILGLPLFGLLAFLRGEGEIAQ